MTPKEALRLKYGLSNYQAINRRVQKLKPILIKRRHAFTIYEWLEIQTLLRLSE